MADPARKKRSDAWEHGLEEDQITLLCEWLLSGLSYKTVRDQCGAEFGLYPSNGQLGRFYQDYVAAEVIKKRTLARTLSEEVGEDIRKSPGNFDEATIDALSQKAFQIASSPLVNAKDVKAIFSLVLKARDQEIKQKDLEIKMRRLEQLERREAEARGILEDGALSIEERERRMKEKFGIS